MPPRPALPQYYDSSERPPHLPPHHRLPTHGHRHEDRKANSKNGAHSVRKPSWPPCVLSPSMVTHLNTVIIFSFQIHSEHSPLSPHCGFTHNISALSFSEVLCCINCSVIQTCSVPIPSVVQGPSVVHCLSVVKGSSVIHDLSVELSSD